MINIFNFDRLDNPAKEACIDWMDVRVCPYFELPSFSFYKRGNMELIERAGFLATLQKEFANIAEGEGHCIFVSGEAGIGKTSLIKAFCKELKPRYNIYQGTCDALFTPRPLPPLYDILLQIRKGIPENHAD